MEGFFDNYPILLGCYGLYFLYLWFRPAEQKKPLETKNILPSDLTMQTCSDPEKLTAYLLPWLFITGLSLVVYAIFSYLFSYEPWFIIVMAVYFILIIFYYSFTMRTVRRRFWPDKVHQKKRK